MSVLKVGAIQPNSGTKVNITGSTLLVTTASGHFSGSYSGDGSGLSGVAGFPFTGSGQLSGSLLVTGSSTLALRVSGSSAFTGSLFVSGTVSGSFTGDGSLLTGVVASGSIQSASVAERATTAILIPVTVVDDGGNKYAFNGVTAPKLSLKRGSRYRFDLSDSTNNGHPFAFRLLDDTSYTPGVTTVGTAGQAGAYVDFDVNFATSASLKYYCTSHGNGMGNRAQIIDVLDGITSGSFSGSFQGDGSNLTGVGGFPHTGSADITGSLIVTGSAFVTTLTETSALRYKKYVKDLNSETNNIYQLRPVHFRWRDDNRKDYGLIAEEVEKIYPDLVTKGNNGDALGISYTKLTALLVKTIQELTDRVEKLENK